MRFIREVNEHPAPELAAEEKHACHPARAITFPASRFGAERRDWLAGGIPHKVGRRHPSQPRTIQTFCSSRIGNEPKLLTTLIRRARDR
jgi:hypothetical protein